MTALRHFRRPEVEVIGDEVILVRRVFSVTADNSTHRTNERQYFWLYIIFLSAYRSHITKGKSFTFMATDRSLTPILDPTHLETVVSSGSLTLTLNPQRELCVLSKAGGTPLAAEEIMTAVKVGVDRVRDMVRTMEEALEADKATRVVEVR